MPPCAACCLPKNVKLSSRPPSACLVAKAPRGSRAVGIEAGRYTPVPEFHKLMEEYFQDNSKADARDRAMIALAW